MVIACIATPCVAQNASLGHWSSSEIQDSVIFPYFKALKSGDVKEIKKYLSTSMYNENKRLLEENKAYPEFLRNYYKDAVFSVEKVSTVDGEAEFDVVVEFPNGSQNIIHLRVLEEMSADETINPKKVLRISDKPSNE